MNYFTQEWPVMRRALLALLLVAAVSGGVAWWATSTYYESHYRERLEATEKRRELAQDELRRVRELSGVGFLSSQKHLSNSSLCVTLNSLRPRLRNQAALRETPLIE